ncbi:MAG: DUF3737 family protein [Treponema sp.]|nr:DUF3737 family protein [Treponema sp.]
MEMIENKELTGERAQYFAKEKAYSKVVFKDGESPLKHASDITVSDSKFEYKYPLWNVENVKVDNSTFYELGKSGLWYIKNMEIQNTVIHAPKEFRRSSGIKLCDVQFTNAVETMWTCNDIKLKNVQIENGDYFAMNSSDFYADNLKLNGNYFLDGGKNIEIHNSVLNSKDAFWNCENVTVYDSVINGEYLGWYSKNLKFVNCTIESDQGLCYIDGLTMINCTVKNTVLAFEYSTNINAEITNKIDSVKNPCGGVIKAPEIGTLIMNPKRCNTSATKIECDKIGQTFTEDPNPNE